MVTLKCTRCYKPIEVLEQPAASMTCYLCNSCAMLWKEKEAKLKGHCEKDDIRKAFISFVNSFTTLRNVTLR